MTTGTEDALRAALTSAIKIANEAVDEWDKAPDGARPGKLLMALAGHRPGYRADIDAIHSAASLPSSGDQRDAVIEQHAKAMSDALLKVRPLGGSELFVRVGDAYYADPKYCGDLIDKMRSDLHDAKMRDAAALKSVPADKEKV